MIVLNELRSGRWEALHKETQLRAQGDTREDALKALVEEMYWRK